MILTSRREDNEATLAAASQARIHVDIWEKSLAYRISLQQITDKFNEFPIIPPSFPTNDLSLFHKNELKLELQDILDETSNLLSKQLPVESIQRKADDDNDDNGEDAGQRKKKKSLSAKWEEIIGIQDELTENWKTIINKWHARTHFGSEKKKASLKVFNQTIWDQIEETMRDETRVIEKSRPSKNESKRKRFVTEEAKEDAGEAREAGDADKEQEQDEDYDCEVYDDRPFYSLLLKSFISGSTGSSTSSSHAAMRPEDLVALKSYKKSKSKVDRKASKGRKIKYVPHEKLKNFMFPIPLYSMTSNHNFSAANDVDRLYQSLFQ